MFRQTFRKWIRTEFDRGRGRKTRQKDLVLCCFPPEETLEYSSHTTASGTKLGQQFAWSSVEVQTGNHCDRSDIEAIFHQVKVPPVDADALRFLC